MKITIALALLVGLLACGEDDRSPAASEPAATADILNVAAGGSEGSYTFAVTIASPDSGCDQYADWWEVVAADGQLLYRRVLLHSHVTEQPFTRTGGPVPISATDRVWIRAHMNVDGYGGQAFSGTVTEGFVEATWPDGLGAGLEGLAPLPQGCNF